MIVQEFVSISYFASNQGVHAENLRAIHQALSLINLVESDGVCLNMETETPPTTALPPNALHTLLFGGVLTARAEDADSSTQTTGEQLDCFIAEVVELLRTEHGEESRAFKQAERELSEIKSMSNSDPSSIACKRGILLFTIWREPTFSERFRASDAALVDDLTQRVLPIIAPSFLANLGQRPDSFVSLCATLYTLWDGVPLALKPGWDVSVGSAPVSSHLP